MKNFRQEFFKLYDLLKNNIPFAFTRFSDGCEAIIRNYKLEITDNKVVFGDITYNKGFSSIDHKLFDPSIPEHQLVRQKLIEAFKFKKTNYFVGTLCKCCVGHERAQYMFDLYGQETEYLTYSNLLVNFNYEAFLHYFVNEFKKKEIILVCNENAILNLPFSIRKDFRVGSNCIINDLNIIQEIKEYYYKYNLKDTVLLSSASSLSNLIIYEMFVNFDQNTYINIGTTLNNYLNLSIDRDYLLAKWVYKHEYGLSHRFCHLY